MKFSLTLALALFASISIVHAEPKPAPDFSLADIDGKSRSLADWQEAPAVVLLFMSTQCPISNRYLPEIAEIAREYGARGVVLVGVNSNRNEQAEVASHAKTRGIAFAVLADPAHEVADKYGIEVTPTVVVLDGKREIRYRGRIDDDPMAGRPRKRDLRAALDAVLSGGEVAEPETAARGCVVRREEPAATGEVTYAKDIAPILAANCVQCHRSGQIGPMALTDFEHASAFSKEIRDAVLAKRMPPWKPVKGLEFNDERKLSDEAIAKIVKWAETGTPRGDPKEEPPMPEFPSGWGLGTPDLVLEMPEDYVVAATGEPDEYRHFVLKTDLPADTWISAAEIRAGNPRVVHHVIAYVDTGKMSEKLDASDPGLGYAGEGTWPGFVPTGEMGGWAPGNVAKALPEGVGRKLVKGAKIVLQVHYNKCGSEQKDRTAIGLYFAKSPIRQQLRWAELVNPFFEIPPGAEAHPVQARWKAPADVTVISVTPHMHLLGKTVSMVATLPDGKEVTFLEIDNWEFKWQDSYMLKNFFKLPKNSIVTHSVTYDNSLKNPYNPSNPPVTVRWGEKTTDEMCLGYVAYVLDSEDLTKEKPKKKKKKSD